MGGFGEGGSDLSSFNGSCGTISGDEDGDGNVAGWRRGDVGVLVGEGGDDVPYGEGDGGVGLVFFLVVK